MKRLLDLFCGAGGAAMGYHEAGFEVVGVDNRPQPHYPFTFHLADALEFLAAGGSVGFDAIHASPPCQYYTRLRHLPWLRDRVYWRSIPPTRAALQATGLPYVIENVEDAGWDMVDSTVICGQDMGLPIYRHRRFETSGFLLLRYRHQPHREVCSPGRASMGKRYANGPVAVKEISRASFAGHATGSTAAKAALGIDWAMTREELSQAIPPAYTRWLGERLLAYLALEPRP